MIRKLCVEFPVEVEKFRRVVRPIGKSHGEWHLGDINCLVSSKEPAGSFVSFVECPLNSSVY